MPRQSRAAPPPRRARGGWTVPGVPWPLPVSPAVVALLAALVVAGGMAWWFEGRFETTPAEAAKRLFPFKAEQVQTLEVITPDGRAEFSRGPDGKMIVDGPPPTPTLPPSPGATPAPVTLSPGARVESIVTQLTALRIDRTLPVQEGNAAEFGLASPKVSLRLVPKTGDPLTLRLGALNPDKTAYYVRREERNDTVLVSRYSLDDLLKVADEIIKGPTA